MAQSKFHHEEIYRGKDAVAKLTKPLIVVCGAGALGSNLADNLARQGFGNLRVIDMDRVETHNVNTQVYSMRDVGAQKVAALKNRIYTCVGVEIDGIPKELDGTNAAKFFKGAYLVVDTFDNHKSRGFVQTVCRANGLNCLHVGLFESFGEVVWDQRYKVPADQVEGDVCDYPLARNIAMLSVVVATEEILDFCLAKVPRRKNWTITLKDLKIRETNGHQTEK